MIGRSCFMMWKRVCRTMLPKKIRAVNRIFQEKFRLILQGYEQYANLKQAYPDAPIFLQYYRGTGDVYLSAAYLKYCQETMRREKTDHPVLAVNGKAAKEVAELFHIKNADVVALHETNAHSLVHLLRFVGGGGECDLCLLHYVSSWPMYTNILISLAGLNGIGFMDLYKAAVFHTDKIKLPTPEWKMDWDWGKEFFKKSHFIPGKTILIAPDAASVAYEADPHFWLNLVLVLRKRGYCVCTNLAKPEEKGIEHTAGVWIPYDRIAIFLEMAGCFIGYRSGLCDLVASVDCKKIILYPRCSWPTRGGAGLNTTLAIFSLKQMGLCRDAVELEYDRKNPDETIKNILDALN